MGLTVSYISKLNSNAFVVMAHYSPKLTLLNV
jgi:hypothetical protein